MVYKKYILFVFLVYTCLFYSSEYTQVNHEWKLVEWPSASSCISFTPRLGNVKYAPQEKLSPSFYKIIQNPPEWMLNQVKNELVYYKNHGTSSIEDLITQVKNDFSDVEKFPPNWKNHLLLSRYKIFKGKLYAKRYTIVNGKDYAPHIKYIDAALLRLLLTISLPEDLEFVISAHDTLSYVNFSAPIFVFGKSKENNFIIAMPDWDMLSDYESRFDPQIDAANEIFPWEAKKDIAFWRGGTTGNAYYRSNWRDFSRAKLVFSSKTCDLIDAKFTQYVQGAESNEEFKYTLAKNDLFGEFISPKESIQYRYLIDIDGNACTWSRFYWILRSNCVPLKQISPNIMWYYSALQSFVHYIPYAHDLSDLPEKIQWAQSHPDECKKIAENSREFVLNELTTEHTYAYLYLLLKEYGSLFDIEFLD